MRRQNHSCDQCRKAKRACNAPSHWDWIRSGEDVGQPDSRALRCSYCLRTGKQCTFDWLRTKFQMIPAAAAAIYASKTSDRDESVHPNKNARANQKAKRRVREDGASTAAPARGSASPQCRTLDADTKALLDVLQIPASSHRRPMASETAFNMSNLPTRTSNSMPARDIFTLNPGFPASVLNMLPTDCQNTPDEEKNTAANSSDWRLFPPQSHNSHQSSPSTSNSSRAEHASRAATIRRSRAHSSSLSPYSASNTMVTMTNKRLIAENLMQIYHDVLEHALSCWLAEDTCPYKMQPHESTNSVTWLSDSFTTLSIRHGYEPWSQDNRIYRRVVKLDRMAQKTKLIKLSRSKDAAATKALNLAIMAFASQWAQGSQRQEGLPISIEGWEGNDGNIGNIGNTGADDHVTEGFDRTLQRTFWAQARRALQDASDLECFRVVCADLIFGLAQKPFNEDVGGRDLDMFESLFDVDNNPSLGLGLRSSSSEVTSLISDIIAQDGPPVSMERAARKMHALKFQYEARQTGVLDERNSFLGLEKASNSPGGHIMDPDDAGTIGLIYWMTVMFDTASSSLNSRPVVVSDEECQHDAAYQQHLGHENQSGYHLHDVQWWDELFSRETQGGRLWFPCSYDVATTGIIAAAPAKVLLFRHVSYLQNLVRSRGGGDAVEEVIINAMAVYRHWQVNYASFFRDLVNQYDTVPPHIQSWFVCVVAHFNLAALLLTDLIELADENNLGIKYAMQVRRVANVVARLRKEGSEVLSDLARVSTTHSSSSLSDSNGPELHFAVAEASILMEPWTMLLIRAFTKAALIQLNEMEDLVRNSQETSRMPALVKRCEDCTRALYCLGQKSDMARRIAGVLSTSLAPFIIV